MKNTHSDSEKWKDQAGLLAQDLEKAVKEISELQPERDRLEAELDAANLQLGTLNSSVDEAKLVADGWEQPASPRPRCYSRCPAGRGEAGC